MNPYIGITDFTDYAQVRKMLGVFNTHKRHGTRRRLQVGVMMNFKALNSLPTSWRGIFPPKETIAGIFASNKTVNCLHYADYDSFPDLAATLCEAISWGGIGITALQLDMVWPSPVDIANAVHMSRKQIEVILQVGELALNRIDNDPPTLVTWLEDYVENDIIQRVLLDKSMGRGLGMDAARLIPFARAIRERYPGLGIVVAGGLGPDSMELVEPLIGEVPNLSIDAQGRLRASGDAHDPVDWQMAGDYLIEALRRLP